MSERRELGQAKAVLRNALTELRALAGKTLEQGRYADVAEIARLADELARIVKEDPKKPEPSIHARSDDSTPKGASTSASYRRRQEAAPYPRFARDADRLVKIGWSKKAAEEYEHRAPFSVAELLLAAVRNKFHDGQLFTASDILPLQNGRDAIPDYQAYMALKWLHTEGVVAKRGRDKYAILPGKLDQRTLQALWKQLPPADTHSE